MDTVISDKMTKHLVVKQREQQRVGNRRINYTLMSHVKNKINK